MYDIYIGYDLLLQILTQPCIHGQWQRLFLSSRPATVSSVFRFGRKLLDQGPVFGPRILLPISSTVRYDLENVLNQHLRVTSALRISHLSQSLILLLFSFSFSFLFFFNSRSKEQNVEIVGWISERGNSWQTFTLHTSGEQIRIFVPVQLEYLFRVGIQ